MDCTPEEENDLRCKCGCGLPQKYDHRIPGYAEFRRGHANRRYAFSRKLFSSIETQEDAYWLGFFIADGYVMSKGSFGIQLASKDVSHLRKFRKYAESNYPIKPCGHGKHRRLEMTSKDHLPVLAKYGLIQKKSRTVRIPKIGNELMPHLVRGIFDGDGWVSYSRKRNCLTIGIVGNRGILAKIRSIFAHECRTNPEGHLYADKRDRAEWYASLSYGGKHVCQRLFDYLYGDAKVYLKRKYMIWKNYTNQ